MSQHGKVFIAGDTSILGRDLKYVLTQKGYGKVISCNSKNLDLKNRNLVELYFKKNDIDVVILVAAKTANKLTASKAPAEIFLDNMKIQNNILEMCYKYDVKRTIFVSSDVALSIPTSRNNITEDDLLSGKLNTSNEAYAMAKLTGTKLCEYMNFQLKEKRFLSILPCYIYGNADKGMIFSIFIDIYTAKTDDLQSVTLWGKPNDKFYLIHSMDVAKAIVLLIEKVQPSYERYLTVSDKFYSKKEIAKIVAHVIDYNGKIFFNGMNFQNEFCIKSAKRLYKEGWHQDIDLKRGITELYEWWQNRM